MRRYPGLWLALAVLVVAEVCWAAGPRDFVQPGSYAAAPPSQLQFGPTAATAFDQNKLLAGHLLRRIGFGPDKKELKKAVKMGLNNYIDMQLNPGSIDDGKCLKQLPSLPSDLYDDWTLLQRWYIRMALSRRQLQEKMTLIWHEHFATSNEKVGVAAFMLDQEELLRKNSLGNFRSLLIDITKDQAMLIWLDNDYNDGNEEDDEGNPLPPNENFAREFLQLFTMGTRVLNLDGTPKLDGNGNPYSPYTENDVREVARALTGWYAPWPYAHNNADFGQWIHDDGNKNILGTVLQGRIGTDGANEVQDVVNIILDGNPDRTNTVAAFISKMLIQKLATETPTPEYVEAVALAFRDSNWNVRTAVETLLKHPEFTSPAVVRSQHKVPIEQFVGMIRALGAKTNGSALINWSYDAGHLLYYPPSVFSFYPPGNKGALTSTATVLIRDRISDEFVRGWSDTAFAPSKLQSKFDIYTPEALVTFLEDRLLTAPFTPGVRSEILAYMNGTVNDTTIRGAIWLALCSPDFQRN